MAISPFIDPTTVVTVSMQINRVALNVESTFDIQILLELEWYDDRLKFLGNECLNTMSDGNFTIEGNEWHYSKIWSPNLRFARNKDPNVLSSHVMLLRITSTGHVRVRIRYSLTIFSFVALTDLPAFFRNNINLFCSMDYRKYPFDTQTCNISLVSSDQTEEKLKLEWSKDQQLKIDDNLFISSHTLEFHKLDNGTKVIKNEKYVAKATQK